MKTPNLQQRPWTAPTRKACWIYFPCTYKWKMQTNKQTNKQTQILHTCNRSTDTVSAGQKSKPGLFALFSVCGDVFIRLTEADAATAWQRWQFFFVCLFLLRRHSWNTSDFASDTKPRTSPDSSDDASSSTLPTATRTISRSREKTYRKRPVRHARHAVVVVVVVVCVQDNYVLFNLQRRKTNSNATFYDHF